MSCKPLGWLIHRLLFLPLATIPPRFLPCLCLSVSLTTACPISTNWNFAKFNKVFQLYVSVQHFETKLESPVAPGTRFVTGSSSVVHSFPITTIYLLPPLLSHTFNFNYSNLNCVSLSVCSSLVLLSILLADSWKLKQWIATWFNFEL